MASSIGGQPNLHLPVDSMGLPKAKEVKKPEEKPEFTKDEQQFIQNYKADLQNLDYSGAIRSREVAIFLGMPALQGLTMKREI